MNQTATSISREDARALRQGLKQHILSDEERESREDLMVFNDDRDATFGVACETLRKLATGEYYDIRFRASKNTSPMMRYVDKLIEVGFDIGHGNATYGYKMPEPKKEDTQRSLRVFRRRN